MHVRRPHLLAAALAVVVAGLYWIDPLFVPLALIGPLVTGALAGRRGHAAAVALAWFAAGIISLVLDLAINGEDAAFHLGLAVVTALLALCAAAVSGRVRPADRRVTDATGAPDVRRRR